MSDYTGDYNDGRDIMPVDVTYQEIIGLDGPVMQASLAFTHTPSMVTWFPKVYVGYGHTKEEACKALVDVMCQHLRRLA